MTAENDEEVCAQADANSPIEGVLIRLNDGRLFFIPECWLSAFRLPDEFQPGGIEHIDLTVELDKVPPLLRVRNAVYATELGSKLAVSRPPTSELPDFPTEAGRRKGRSSWTPFRDATISQTTKASALRAIAERIPQ